MRCSARHPKADTSVVCAKGRHGHNRTDVSPQLSGVVLTKLKHMHHDETVRALPGGRRYSMTSPAEVGSRLGTHVRCAGSVSIGSGQQIVLRRRENEIFRPERLLAMHNHVVARNVSCVTGSNGEMLRSLKFSVPSADFTVTPGVKGRGNSTLNMSLPAMAHSEILPPASP